jgi:hypothetical protein
VNEVEEEIEELENEIFALDKIAEYLYTADFDPIDVYSFLEDEINEQLELLESLENYTYDMFVEDRWDAEEEAVIEMINEALADEWDDVITEFVSELETEETEEVNGCLRGPFSVISKF